MSGPIRLAVAGVGNRALPKRPETSNFLGWIPGIAAHPGYTLVAAQDVSPEARDRLARSGLLGPEKIFSDLRAMLDAVPCEALLVCTPAEFHATATREALKRGLHLLLEKPLVTDLAEGAALVRDIEAAGKVSLVVQNWRFKDVGRALRQAVTSGRLGRVGQVFFRYVRNRENPNYPEYIFAEPYPLLYAMGIHHLDLFRHILGDEVARIDGCSFKPPWSLYASVTGHSLRLWTKGGVFVGYEGTISSKSGGFPQESLVVEGEGGTLVCDSDWLDPPLLFYPAGAKEPVDLTADVADRSVRGQYDAADAFLLDNFRAAVREGATSACPAADSFASLVLLEAARRSCETGEPVSPDALLEELGARGR
jgi:predicted dehydrogenase